jgi:hypothetical protein
VNDLDQQEPRILLQSSVHDHGIVRVDHDVLVLQLDASRVPEDNLRAHGLREHTVDQGGGLVFQSAGQVGQLDGVSGVRAQRGVEAFDSWVRSRLGSGEMSGIDVSTGGLYLGGGRKGDKGG